MPVTPTYPGVYIEEVPSGVHTITSVATSIAAFFGRASKGPVDKAVRVLNLAAFERNFGKPHPNSDLAYSVRQFFTNGGTDCYVVRLAHGARNASLHLRDIYNRNVLTVTAKTGGVWGDSLRLEVDYSTACPDETFNLVVIHEEAGSEVSRETHTALSMDPNSARFAPSFVTQSSSLIDVSLHADAQAGGGSDLRDFGTANSFAGFSQSRVLPTTPIAAFRTAFETLLTNTPTFTMNVDDTQYVPIDLSTVLGSTPPAIAPGSTWSLASMVSRIEDVVNPQISAVVPGASIECSWETHGNYSALRFTSSSGGPAASAVAANQRTSVRIRRSSTNDFAGPTMLGLDQGGVEVGRYSGFRPVPTASFFHDVDDFVQMAGLTRDAIASIQVDGSTPVPIDFSSMTPAASDPWFLDSNGNNDGVREKLRAIVQAVNNASGLDWQAELWGYHLALVAKSGSINRTSSGVVSAADAFLGGANFTHNVRRYTLGITGTSAFQIAGTAGVNDGSDGTAPQLVDFQGSPTLKTGFHALDDVDLFNLMIIPGDEGISESTHSSLWGPASTYCASRRAFLLVDAPASWTSNGLPAVVENTSLINGLRTSIVKDYAAVFYPWLKYLKNGLIDTIGPSGAIAGLMARTDANRGVWKAPAGIEADIRNVSGLEVKLTDRENGVLNKKGVNCLRLFPSGIVNWGARTLFGDDDFTNEWKYVPVRRLALMLEESLFRGTKWVVFEPNDEPLWAKIRLNVGAYMMSLFRQGAFQGTDPKDAFYVKCDKETTTQDDINKGIVNIEVGFAPLKPAEFVIIRIQQWQPNLNA